MCKHLSEVLISGDCPKIWQCRQPLGEKGEIFKRKYSFFFMVRSLSRVSHSCFCSMVCNGLQWCSFKKGTYPDVLTWEFFRDGTYFSNGLKPPTSYNMGFNLK